MLRFVSINDALCIEVYEVAPPPEPRWVVVPSQRERRLVTLAAYALRGDVPVREDGHVETGGDESVGHGSRVREVVTDQIAQAGVDDDRPLPTRRASRQ